ncbi:MAG: glycosyltransferase family 39 protein [Candidatus Aminicenantes bacterium]|nr:glycosyltransferase family 39 protein [Candidatus Aminicenantes bacterium]
MADDAPGPVRRDRRDLAARILVGVLLAGWLVLMLRNLGVLSLWMDEGFHYLAARGILEHGYPLFPSGHIFWKAILYAYVLAAGSFLFGLKAVTLRVISVFCVAGLVALTYHVGRRFFSRTVGVLAAVLLAFSAWELEYARAALYFAPLQLCYLAGLYFFFRGYVEDEKRFKFPAVLFFLFTPLIHQLGMGVIFAYPALFLMRGARRFFRRDVLVGLTVMVLLYLGIQIQEFFFWKVGYVYEKTEQSFGGMIGYFFGNFNLDYFREFFRSFPRMSLTVLAGVLLCLGTVVWRRKGGRPMGEPAPARSPWLFLNLCLVFPLFFFGFFRTHVQPRYLAQLYPVFILLFLLALRAIGRGIVDGLAAPAFGIEKDRTRAIFSGLIGIGLVFILTEGVRPGRLLSVVNRRYGDPITADIITSSGRFEHYDHESVGKYVAAKLRPDDVVIAIHVVFQKIYVGRVDYWLWSGGPGTWDAWEKTADGWKDFYVGARWINNASDLRRTIEANPGRRIWLVTSPSLFRNDHINPALYDYISVKNADKLVYRGKDGMSEVYVWNDPELTAGGRRTCEGEWLSTRRGVVLSGPGMSGRAAVSWDGRGGGPDESTTKIVRRFAAGAYRATVRYKSGPGLSGETSGRISLVDGRGKSLRTVVLSGDSRRVDEEDWREADVEFFVAREQAVGIRVQVPAGCALAIDYIDIRPKEGEP